MHMGSNPAGRRPDLVMAIGERVILRRFVEACGGPDADIVVLATASEVLETGERYADPFYAIDADVVEVLRIRTR